MTGPAGWTGRSSSSTGRDTTWSLSVRPRSPAELQTDGRVLTQDGQDVTAAYQAGAERVLEIARENNCAVAVLKARSPSCGCGEIYDGTFTHRVKPGWGIAARLLADAGIEVMDEEHLQASLYL